jgi:UDP-glucose 4-epimerase
MMKTILITGVAGMIGSRMAEWIIEHQKEYNIVGIDNLSGGYIENIPAGVEFVQADLATENLDDIFSKYAVEYVLHFAAYAAEGLSPFIRKYNYTNNLVATANIVNACIKYKVKRLVFTSSMAVYGHSPAPFTESTPAQPADPYGVAKMACELDIQIAGEQHQLDWCILRPHNVYGRNQNIWDKYRNVLGIWMYQHLNNQAFSIFGDGSQKRAFSAIEDCLLPMWNAMVLPVASKQIINIGSDIEISVLSAAETLKEVMGQDAQIQFLEQRHEVKNAYSTHDKAVSILGYSDRTSLKEGLTAMWAWAIKQPKRKRMEWDAYEIDNGMYDSWKK